MRGWRMDESANGALQADVIERKPGNERHGNEPEAQAPWTERFHQTNWLTWRCSISLPCLTPDSADSFYLPQQQPTNPRHLAYFTSSLPHVSLVQEQIERERIPWKEYKNDILIDWDALIYKKNALFYFILQNKKLDGKLKLKWSKLWSYFFQEENWILNN